MIVKSRSPTRDVTHAIPLSLPFRGQILDEDLKTDNDIRSSLERTDAPVLARFSRVYASVTRSCKILRAIIRRRTGVIKASVCSQQRDNTSGRVLSTGRRTRWTRDNRRIFHNGVVTAAN